jgi:CheY-like chemotaxis protein
MHQSNYLVIYEGVAMTVVLVAEDNDDIRFALTFVLRRAGFTVLEASDGIAALKLAVRERPDVIVTDLDMPRLTGLELCQAIRGHHELRDTPVAILSGSLRPGDDRAAEVRLCGVLLKPIANQDLVTAVERLAARGRHEHETALNTCPLAAAGR